MGGFSFSGCSVGLVRSGQVRSGFSSKQAFRLHSTYGRSAAVVKRSIRSGRARPGVPGFRSKEGLRPTGLGLHLALRVLQSIVVGVVIVVAFVAVSVTGGKGEGARGCSVVLLLALII